MSDNEDAAARAALTLDDYAQRYKMSGQDRTRVSTEFLTDLRAWAEEHDFRCDIDKALQQYGEEDGPAVEEPESPIAVVPQLDAEDRELRGAWIARAYGRYGGGKELEHVATDMMTDMLHLSAEEGWSFEAAYEDSTQALENDFARPPLGLA